METSKLIVSLPTNDLTAAFQFYRAVGLELASATQDDTMPEPVEFVVNDGVNLMIVPRGGFGWVSGGNDVAPRGVSECILSMGAESEAQVDSLAERVRRAGGEVASGPERQSWGYSATFKDLDGHVWMAVCPR